MGTRLDARQGRERALGPRSLRRRVAAGREHDGAVRPLSSPARDRPRDDADGKADDTGEAYKVQRWRQTEEEPWHSADERQERRAATEADNGRRACQRPQREVTDSERPNDKAATVAEAIHRSLHRTLGRGQGCGLSLRLSCANSRHDALSAGTARRERITISGRLTSAKKLVPVRALITSFRWSQPAAPASRFCRACRRGAPRRRSRERRNLGSCTRAPR
jgi:hypothetical protein